MSNRALFAVAGFAGLCLCLSAQQAAADQLHLGALDHSSPLPPSLSLEDRQTFFFATSFGWVPPAANFLPTFDPVQPQSTVSRNPARRRNSLDEGVELRSADRIHVGGEIGFLYGRSSGKYSVEYEQGYVIGELGNDHFHLTVGTSYERSSGRFPRWGR